MANVPILQSALILDYPVSISPNIQYAWPIRSILFVTSFRSRPISVNLIDFFLQCIHNKCLSPKLARQIFFIRINGRSFGYAPWWYWWSAEKQAKKNKRSINHHQFHEGIRSMEAWREDRDQRPAAFASTDSATLTAYSWVCSESKSLSDARWI